MESFLAKPSALRVMIFADAGAVYKGPNNWMRRDGVNYFDARERFASDLDSCHVCFSCMSVVLCCWVNRKWGKRLVIACFGTSYPGYFVRLVLAGCVL